MAIHGRRSYFINKSVQSRHMGMMAVLTFIVSVLTGWMVYSTILYSLVEGISQEPALYIILAEINRVIFLRVSLVIFSGMCISAVITMFVLHRIAGPILRFENCLREIGEGSIPRKITFRRKDEFKGLAEVYNSIVQRLEDVKAANTEAIQNARRLLEEGKDAEAVKKELDKLQVIGGEDRNSGKEPEAAEV